MSYLSRIWINPRRRQARQYLANPQLLHAAVLAGIPKQPVAERVLWRIDADEPFRPALLVLSQSQPSWESIVEDAGWPSAYNPEDPQALVRSYGPLIARLGIGQEYAFRLTANPVKSTRPRIDREQEKSGEDHPRKRSARHGQVTVAQQIEWLTSRAEQFGFSIPESSASEAMNEPIPDLRIIRRDRVEFRRGKGKSPVTLRVVTYEGRLVISDPSVLADKLLSGFGPAKAYGCGLMTLAPLAGS